MPNEIFLGRRVPDVLRDRIGLALALLAALTISACSIVRVGYEAIPWYAFWQLDRYWALDSAQAAYGQDSIEELLRWHRRSELPEYARWLRRINERIQAPIDLAEAMSWRRAMNGFWTRAVHRIAPELTEIVVTLRTEQVEQMKKRMASENDDYRKEYLPEDLSERQTRRIKRIEERIEYYLGGITDRQREIVRQMAALMPRNELVWLQERLARQHDLTALLDRLRRPGQTLSDVERQEASRQVTDFLLSVWEPQDPRRRQSLEEALKASDEITMAVLNVATPAQRTALSRRLSGWANELEALAR